MTRRSYTPPAIRCHGPVEIRTRGGFDPTVMDPTILAPAVQGSPYLAVLIMLILGLFSGSGTSAGGTSKRTLEDFS